METNKSEWKSNLISFNAINLVQVFVCWFRSMRESKLRNEWAFCIFVAASHRWRTRESRKRKWIYSNFFIVVVLRRWRLFALAHNTLKSTVSILPITPFLFDEPYFHNWMSFFIYYCLFSVVRSFSLSATIHFSSVRIRIGARKFTSDSFFLRALSFSLSLRWFVFRMPVYFRLYW